MDWEAGVLDIFIKLVLKPYMPNGLMDHLASVLLVGDSR